MSLAENMWALEGVVALILADPAVWLHYCTDVQLVLRARVTTAPLRVVASADLALLVVGLTDADAMQRVRHFAALALVAFAMSGGPVH